MFQRHVDAGTLQRMARTLIFEEFLTSYAKSVLWLIACQGTLTHALCPLPSLGRTEREHFEAQCAMVLEEYSREVGVKKSEPTP